MDFARGGELFFMLREKGQMSESTVRFYTSQLVLAFEHLHSNKILYRDLKPENILLDHEGNIVLTDFGLAKIIVETNSFCGTPDYIPPEIILNKKYTRSVDWWQLGILIYELLTGHTPFFHHNVDKMFQFILEKPLKKNPYLSETVFDLISKLLIKDPLLRLGHSSKDAEEIKSHPFFKDVDWGKIKRKEIKPPFKIKENQIGYFDKKSLVSQFKFFIGEVKLF